MIYARSRWLLLGLALASLMGCGDGPERYLEVARGQLAISQEMVGILKTVRDAASMKEARAQLRRLEWKAEEIALRAKGLAPPSLAIQEKLEAELSRRRQEVLDETKAEIQRIQELPGGPAFLDSMKLQPGNDSSALALP